MVTGEMSPYLLLGFLIAGVLHVFVPRRFYAKYLSRLMDDDADGEDRA